MGQEKEELDSDTITPERLRELADAFPFDVASHAKTPPELLATLATNADESTRWMVARRKQTPVEALVVLTKDAATRVRIAAFCHASLPDDARGAALTDPDAEVRALCASNVDDEASLRALGADADASVRAAVAAREACPADLLEGFTRDPDDAVRAAVAAAEHAPLELVERLAGDPSSDVLCAVAARATSAPLLVQLAGHPDGRVREAVVDNPDTPPEVLDSLATDAAEAVRHAIVWRDQALESTLDKLSRDPAEKVRMAVASRGTASRAALGALLRDAAPRVRAAAAADVRIEEPELLALARDADTAVRAAARKHPKATDAVRAMVKAEDDARKRYAEEPGGREEALMRLLSGPYAPDSRSTVGGAAFLPEGVAWPRCKQCEEPLALFFQLALDGIPAWVRPGSHLAVFACRKHDDVPTRTSVKRGERLPRDAWATTEGHVHVRLDPPDAKLVSVAAPSPGLAPHTLSFERAVEDVREVGPLLDRFFIGRSELKAGGVPSWVQEPEYFRCWCGAWMRLLAEVPADHRFPVEGADREIRLFLGCELYVLGCERQCDALAVWPVVQN